MSGDQIEIGDVVQLKSGGPYMTVLDVRETTPVIAYCIWFHQGAKSEAEFFSFSLTKKLIHEARI